MKANFTSSTIKTVTVKDNPGELQQPNGNKKLANSLHSKPKPFKTLIYKKAVQSIK